MTNESYPEPLKLWNMCLNKSPAEWTSAYATETFNQDEIEKIEYKQVRYLIFSTTSDQSDR